MSFRSMTICCGLVMSTFAITMEDRKHIGPNKSAGRPAPTRVPPHSRPRCAIAIARRCASPRAQRPVSRGPHYAAERHLPIAPLQDLRYKSLGRV
jgi:hypothetical protein